MKTDYRTIKEVGEEYEKLWEKIWYHRHMAAGAPEVGKENASRIEATWGKDYLEIENDLEYSFCLGRMMTLAWVLGAEWDEAGDT